MKKLITIGTALLLSVVFAALLVAVPVIVDSTRRSAKDRQAYLASDEYKEFQALQASLQEETRRAREEAVREEAVRKRSQDAINAAYSKPSAAQDVGGILTGLVCILTVPLAIFLLKGFDVVAGRGPHQVADGIAMDRERREH